MQFIRCNGLRIRGFPFRAVWPTKLVTICLLSLQQDHIPMQGVITRATVRRGIVLQLVQPQLLYHPLSFLK